MPFVLLYMIWISPFFLKPWFECLLYYYILYVWFFLLLVMTNVHRRIITSISMKFFHMVYVIFFSYILYGLFNFFDRLNLFWFKKVYTPYKNKNKYILVLVCFTPCSKWMRPDTKGRMSNDSLHRAKDPIIIYFSFYPFYDRYRVRFH
jgi:hypothetical protein